MLSANRRQHASRSSISEAIAAYVEQEERQIGEIHATIGELDAGQAVIHVKRKWISGPISGKEATEANLTSERRARQRFPLNLEVRFTANKRGLPPIEGHGEVVNIGSQGVAFRTATTLMPNLNIDASIEWPVALNGDCVLRVSLEGRVLRVENGLSVMCIDRYEFRTGGRVGTPSSSEMEALKRRIGNLLIPAAPSHQMA